MTWHDWNPYNGISPWIVAGVCGVCLFFAVCYEWRVHRRKSGGTAAGKADTHGRGYWIAATVFWVFTILCATYFGRETSENPEAKWQLFWTLEAAIRTGAWRYWYFIVGNIFLFVPLGFVLMHVTGQKHRIVWCIGLCFFLSVLIEALQYITGTGLCELDDVMHNTLGGGIGVLLAEGFRAFSRHA